MSNSIPDSPLSDNYQYWREHGNVWADEYVNRKKKQVYYHLQELMFLDYMERHAPARVLDYGCGVGRHLRNLVHVPGIEVYGYDQSRAMVQGCLKWTSQDWIDQHIKVGNPVGELPYPDKFFDIVFTSEVLIHTSPSDIQKVLLDLIRVSSWQILHIEPSYNTLIHEEAHYGSWNHDLIKSYEQIGYTCELLPSGYLNQSPYRVILSEERKITQWPLSILYKLRDIESALQPTISTLEDDVQKLSSQLTASLDTVRELEKKNQQVVNEKDAVFEKVEALDQALKTEKETANFQISKLQGELASRDKDIEELKTRILAISAHETSLEAELRNIQSSRSFRLVQKIKQSSVSGLIFSSLRVLTNTKEEIQSLRFRSRRNAPKNGIRIVSSVKKNYNSQGKEIWLLDIISGDHQTSFQSKKISLSSGWKYVNSEYTRSKKALFSSGTGSVDVFQDDVESLIFQTHPWSGIVEIIHNGEIFSVDLYNGEDGTAEVRVKSGEIIYGPSLLQMTQNPDAVKIPGYQKISSSLKWSESDICWIERVKTSGQPVAIMHPNWLGIRSSTCQLFQEVYELQDNLTEFTAEYYAKLIIESRTPAVVIQGFPLSYIYLLRALKKYAPQLPIYNIWHGNFMQSSEDYNWKSFQTVEILCREGMITKWGFVKKGMSDSMAQRGIRTGFVMNYVRQIPQAPAIPDKGGPHFGLWASSNTWRKLPYAMMASLVEFPGADVFAAGHASERVQEFASLMGINLNFHGSPIKQEEMPKYLAKMHLNLYITLSECTPMVPLESFSVGVPCLLGPNSHLFEDNEYLFSRVVVPFPERAEIISKYIHRALDERDEIVRAYQVYAPEYNQRAKASLNDFLDGLMC